MPGHNSYLGSDRFIQNTYEQVLRNQGFTDDNNSGSVQDEEADFLKTLQRIKTKGDAGYYDMNPLEQELYDKKNEFSNTMFENRKLIPPAPAPPMMFGNQMMGDTLQRLSEEREKFDGERLDRSDFAKEFLKNYDPPEDEVEAQQIKPKDKFIPGREGDPTSFFKQFGLGGK